MSEVFDIYTLLFLVLAVVIFIRLRNVLGRRTGNERPPYDPYSAGENSVPQGKSSDTVVDLPRRREGGSPSAEPSGPSAADIEARIEDFAPKGSPLAKSLTKLLRTDPNFDPATFLEGAKVAYEMVIAGYAEGDETVLKQLLDEDVFDSFKRNIDERRERGEKAETTLVGIQKADIIEAEVKGSVAQVTVRFGSELVTVVRNSNEEVIEGDPETVRDVTDIWTFARDTGSSDPNWKLVSTQTAN
ncbi:Tim44/TimA family putative adaptor protein [Methyloligella sp. 2.7D]|uniref:Tim44/TimA family putative adaptor protein n=1 Tax=unclassified Methyloligella TaxID=2625955 RepID=UPI00157CC1BD|nr:Tim44/TimA family putative adaptor protein [Methyloligella sp. GL2]QKP76281.1 Tim44 domain-containing protein [Methyloligella sp. GL2]